MSIIPEFDKSKIDAIVEDMPTLSYDLSPVTVQLCLHLLTMSPEIEGLWVNLGGASFNDVLIDYVYMAQNELLNGI